MAVICLGQGRESVDDQSNRDVYRHHTTRHETSMAPFSFSERDLDLIQLEELHAANGYADWFADRIGLTDHRFVSARHSVSATVNGSGGETDLFVVFEKGGKRTAVLIEDKISAAFTHRQAERYVERGEDLVRNGEADAFRTVLVAPQQYLASVHPSDPWHMTIPVEEVASWFEARSGHHYRWRFEALTAITQKLARNLSASSEDAARFSMAFSQYLKAKHAPNLRHNPGRDRSGPIIGFPGSSAKKTLWWKVATNQMTMQLMDEYEGLAKRLELPVGIDLELASEHGRKCDYLVAAVPAVEFAEPFDTQVSVVEDALDTARRLIDVVPRLEAMLISNS